MEYATVGRLDVYLQQKMTAQPNGNATEYYNLSSMMPRQMILFGAQVTTGVVFINDRNVRSGVNDETFECLEIFSMLNIMFQSSTTDQ